MHNGWIKDWLKRNDYSDEIILVYFTSEWWLVIWHLNHGLYLIKIIDSWSRVNEFRSQFWNLIKIAVPYEMWRISSRSGRLKVSNGRFFFVKNWLFQIVFVTMTMPISYPRWPKWWYCNNFTTHQKLAGIKRITAKNKSGFIVYSRPLWTLKTSLRSFHQLW